MSDSSIFSNTPSEIIIDPSQSPSICLPLPRQVYQGQGPKGRYYFVSSGKIVPGQVLRGGVPNPKFDVTKYEIIAKPANRAHNTVTRPEDYVQVRLSNLSIRKKITQVDTQLIAASIGWRLSVKAQRALCALGKSVDQLKELLTTFKESEPDSNYLDYDIKDNQFLAKWREIPSSAPVTPVASDL